MPSPSPLAVGASCLTRLVKERKTYESELAEQQTRVDHLQAEFTKHGNSKDENAGFKLKQEKLALHQTSAVLAPLDDQIRTTLEKVRTLEAQAKKSDTYQEDLEKAADALKQGEKLLRG